MTTKTRHKLEIDTMSESLSELDKSYIAACLGSPGQGAVQLWTRYKQHWGCVAQQAPADCGNTVPEIIKRPTYARADVYHTVNTMYWTKQMHYDTRTAAGIRTADRTCSVRGLAWDIDYHSVTPFERTMLQDMIATAAERILSEIEAGNLPDMWVKYTGRGLGLMATFAPTNPNNIDDAAIVEAVSDAVHQKLVSVMKYDPAADVDGSIEADITRVTRVPGTINTHSQTYCHVLREQQQAHTIADYAASTGAEQPKSRCQTLCGINMALVRKVVLAPGNRYERLCSWISANPKQGGNRYNIIWTVSAVLVGAQLTKPEINDILPRVQSANALFDEPLPEAEICHAVKCCINGYRQGYTISNRKVARKIGMEPDDAKLWQLDFTGHRECEPGRVEVDPRIVGWVLSTFGDDTRQQNHQRDADRKKRAKEKADNYAQIPELKKQGYTQKEIAAQLRIGIATVKRHW